jgi:hypothetical protein
MFETKVYVGKTVKDLGLSPRFRTGSKILLTDVEKDLKGDWEVTSKTWEFTDSGWTQHLNLSKAASSTSSIFSRLL